MVDRLGIGTLAKESVMSRPPLSEHEQWLKGSRPTRAAESKFCAGRPRMPKHLSPVAAEKWKELVRLLAKRGTLTAVDASALEIYCEQYARYRKLLKELDQHGEMVEVEVLDSSGVAHTKRVQNPAAKLVTQLENSMRAYQKEFSITPASREKSKPAVPKETPAKKTPEQIEEEAGAAFLKGGKGAGFSS
jgi:P27 family predicted phage terminase small subunit